MSGGYGGRLSGHGLERCYALAPPRVRRYLEAEIEHVDGALRPTDSVLELGCGYGRVAFRLARAARHVVGIDTSVESLGLARQMAGTASTCRFACATALALPFADREFDAVVCVQNGICAFGVDPERLLRESVRVVRPGGSAWFSTYADRFWPERLAWFERQSAEGLLGPIDRAATGNGVIACRDGFRVGRLAPEELRALCARLGLPAEIGEVDGSSVFCRITPPAAA